MKKPYWIKVVSGIATVAMIGTTVGACYMTGPVVDAEEKTSSSVSSGDGVELDGDTDDILSDILNNRVTHNTSDVDKEETVFVMGDANGANDKVVVTDWLKNKDGASTIDDASNLKDITNLKGDETYKTSGDKIVWAANGKDIHYQGTATAKPPIDVKVTYYLDDKEIAPKDLAGKSGHVKIRFDYKNNAMDEISVSGNDQEQINVPFGVMSGMLLDNEKFSNIEVTNGKMVDEGDLAFVVGVAFPGLQKSLNLTDDELGDTTIPEYVEVEADVVNFSLDMTMSVALSDALQDFDLSDQKLDTSDLTDSMDDLQDASTKLVNGSNDLNNGVDDLVDGSNDLKKGTGDLKNGASDMKGGVEKLYSGLKTYTDGVGTLTDGTDELKTGSTKLYQGISDVKGGIGTLDSGLNDLQTSSASYDAGMAQLQTAMKAYYANELSVYSSTIQAGLVQGLGGVDNYKAVMSDTQKTTLLATTAKIMAGIDNSYMQQGSNLNSLVSATIAQYQAKGFTIDAKTAVTNIFNTAVSQNSTLSAEQKAVLTSSTNVFPALLYSIDMQAGTSQKSVTDPVAAAAKTTRTSAENALNQYQASSSAPVTITGQSAPLLTTQSSSEVLPEGTTESSTSNGSGSTSTGNTETGSTTNTAENSGSNGSSGSTTNGAATNTASSESNAGTSSTTVTTNGNTTETTTTVTTPASGASNITVTPQQLTQIMDTAETAGTQAGNVTVTVSNLSYEEMSDAIWAAISCGTIDTLKGYEDQIYAGVQKLKTGADTLYTGADTLMAGLKTLDEGIASAKEGAHKLDDKAGDILKGTLDLYDGSKSMLDGTTKLDDGATDLVSGVNDLKDGSKELHDGMVKFDQDGIQELTSNVNGKVDDINEFSDRLNAVIETGKDYDSYSGLASGKTGDVKFIYKTAAIKSDSDDE